MTEHSHSSSHLRRRPKQQRGKERVTKILDAAAAVFNEVGYDAATTHQIAAKAGTAIGSLYQFFPNKTAIFNAMELRHVERVKVFWAKIGAQEVIQLPLRSMIRLVTASALELFEHPVSRVVFIQFYMAREIFQSIDDGMTQEAINFLAGILKQRNPALNPSQADLLAEVCVHSSNAVILAALRSSDPHHRQQLTQQIEDLLVSYLESHVGDSFAENVMKVMKCPHCQSKQISKNGSRRGKQCYLCKDCGKQFVDSVLRNRQSTRASTKKV